MVPQLPHRWNVRVGPGLGDSQAAEGTVGRSLHQGQHSADYLRLTKVLTETHWFSGSTEIFLGILPSWGCGISEYGVHHEAVERMSLAIFVLLLCFIKPVYVVTCLNPNNNNTHNNNIKNTKNNKNYTNVVCAISTFSCSGGLKIMRLPQLLGPPMKNQTEEDKGALNGSFSREP